MSCTDEYYEEALEKDFENNSFEPDWASPPGDTVMDLVEKGRVQWWEVASLFDRHGNPRNDYTRFIRGEIAVTEELAEKLSYLLGSSPQFWLNREAKYREAVARLYAKKNGDQESK